MLLYGSINLDLWSHTAAWVRVAS